MPTRCETDILSSIGLFVEKNASFYERRAGRCILCQLQTDSNVVIRDCAENDYGNFCQQFELESPGVAVAATQQQQTKHEICISTCRSSSCNKVPVVE